MLRATIIVGCKENVLKILRVICSFLKGAISCNKCKSPVEEKSKNAEMCTFVSESRRVQCDQKVKIMQHQYINLNYINCKSRKSNNEKVIFLF